MKLQSLIYTLKRIELFFYYCYALQFPHYDVYIFSPALAWQLAGIVLEGVEAEKQLMAEYFSTVEKRDKWPPTP